MSVKTMTFGAVGLFAAALTLAAPSHADESPVNLPVTDLIRDQLFEAAATLTDHPASDYTGLTPGTTYYAYDPILDTYWAGASLAGPKSEEAAIMLQDANSYMVFRKSGQDGGWLATRVGFGPSAAMPPKGDCPLPPAVHDLWQLMPDFCHP